MIICFSGFCWWYWKTWMRERKKEKEINHFVFYYTTPPFSSLRLSESLYLKLLHHSFLSYLSILPLSAISTHTFLFSTFLLLPLFIIPLFPLPLANKFINTCNSDIVSRRIQESHLNFPPYSSKPTIILKQNKPIFFFFFNFCFIFPLHSFPLLPCYIPRLQHGDSGERTLSKAVKYGPQIF